MGCGLLDNLMVVEHRARRAPVWGAITGSMRRDRRFRWALMTGSHLLYRGVSLSLVDFDYPVGAALKRSTITEVLASRPVVDGVLAYVVKAVGKLGVEDSQPPLLSRTNVFVTDGMVELPAPLAPVAFRVEPIAGGLIRVIAQLDNVSSDPPAASIAIYSDGGTGVMDYVTALGADHPVAGAYPEPRVDRDPGVAHGTRLRVGVRAKSAAGAEETNTVTQIVEIDAEGPAAIAGVALELQC